MEYAKTEGQFVSHIQAGGVALFDDPFYDGPEGLHGRERYVKDGQPMIRDKGQPEVAADLKGSILWNKYRLISGASVV